MRRSNRMLAFSVGALIVLAMVSAIGPATTSAFTDIDQDQAVIDEVFCVQPNAASACYNGAAQTLTAGLTGDLTAVQLPLTRESFTTFDLVIEIHAAAPDGALLATSNPVAAANIPIAPEMAWITFTFPTPASVASGDVIAIVMPPDPLYPTADPRWGWGKAGSDVYAGGVAWGGVSGGPWQGYVDGSDFAFTTFVTTAPPTCDVAVAFPGENLIGEGVEMDPADAPVDVHVGDQLEIFLLDFPPLTAVTFGSSTQSFTNTTDVLGEFTTTLVFEPGDEGVYPIVGYPTGDPDCTDGVLLSITAAPASPTPTPTSTTPTTPAPIPNTASGGPTGRASVAVLWLAGILALSLAGGWITLRRGSQQRSTIR